MFGYDWLYNGLSHLHIETWCNKHNRCIRTRTRLFLNCSITRKEGKRYLPTKNKKTQKQHTFSIIWEHFVGWSMLFTVGYICSLHGSTIIGIALGQSLVYSISGALSSTDFLSGHGFLSGLRWLGIPLWLPDCKRKAIRVGSLECFRRSVNRVSLRIRNSIKINTIIQIISSVGTPFIIVRYGGRVYRPVAGSYL